MPRHIEHRDTQTVRTDPRISTLIHSAFDTLSRRRFLVGTAVAGVGLYFLGKRIDPGFFDNPVQATQEVIDVSNRLNTFLNSAPNPTKLIEQAYRHNEGFYFPRSDIGKISLSLFGDSMNLLNGTREGNGAGTNQQGSWGDIARDNVNAFFDRTGETTHRWKYYNYAIPGSSTLGLTGDEEYDNNAQLTNPDARNKILNDPYTQLISIGLNGNNWKRTGAYAVYLYNNSPQFQKLMKTLELKNKSFIDNLVTKGDQIFMLLTDQQLRNQLNGLMDLFDQDSAQFKTGLTNAFNVVEDLNKTRSKMHPKYPPIKLAVTLPIDLALRDVVPWAPPKAKRGVRGQFNYGNIPNAKEAVYRVTATIYTVASDLLREYSQHRNFPEAITIPFFGLEKNTYLFANDGHFDLEGETEVALSFLRRIYTDQGGQRISLADILFPSPPQRRRGGPQ